MAIDVAFAGVGFVDTLFRSGAIPLQVPFTPGIEATGKVREIGPDVLVLTPGQRSLLCLTTSVGPSERAGTQPRQSHIHAEPCPERLDAPAQDEKHVRGLAA